MTKRSLASLLAASSLVAAPCFAEETRGRVETRAGVPIENALVQDVRTGAEVSTDHQGTFALSCEAPCRLLLSHPRFLEQRIEAWDPASELVVALEPKQEVYEEIVVTAQRGGGDTFAPVAIASTLIRAEERAAAPSTLVELVEGAPGVAENGQGGIFQTFSIRGVARQRVMTLVDGMRVTGERRAGVSASFIDPLLLGPVDVLRGPSSTYYGSGALGGVVQVFARDFEKLHLTLGYDSWGDETYQFLGWGDGAWSLGLAHRTRSNDAVSTAAGSTEINDHFTQLSASLSRRWDRAGYAFRFQALPSYGDDIGKANTDFPERTTSYPDESHLLLKLDVTAPSGWSLDVWAHPNDLTTEVVRGTERNVVSNDAFDLGMSFERPMTLAGKLSGRYGFDYVGRRGVRAVESDEDLASGARTEQRTLDGEQDEAAAFASLSWSWGRATFQGGLRTTWQRQSNVGWPRREDSAVTGFLGVVRPIGRVELVANLGTGFLFPDLSERFFTGTTGRGQVLGNPDLGPESSLNADLGLRWYGRRLFLAGHVFQLRIADYIERIDLEDETRAFVNLSSGTVRGLELEGFYEISERWLLSWSGHLQGGEDVGGAPLPDVPADRLRTTLQFRQGRWESRLSYQYRARKDDPGPGERAIPGADLLSLSLEFRLAEGLTLALRGRNLLGEAYWSVADDKATLAAGRSLGLGLAWQR